MNSGRPSWQLATRSSGFEVVSYKGSGLTGPRRMPKFIGNEHESIRPMLPKGLIQTIQVNRKRDISRAYVTELGGVGGGGGEGRLR